MSSTSVSDDGYQTSEREDSSVELQIRDDRSEHFDPNGLHRWPNNLQFEFNDTQRSSDYLVLIDEHRMLKKDHTRQRKVSICAVVLATLSLLSTASFVVLLLFQRPDVPTGTIQGTGNMTKNKNTRKQLCLPCYRLDPFNDLDLEGDIERKNNECCVGSLDSLLNIVRKVTANRINREISQGNIHTGPDHTVTTSVSNKPSALLVCCRPPAGFYPATVQSEAEVRHWVTDRLPSYRRQVGLQGGRLIIQRTGLYFVYAHVSFIVNESDRDTKQEWFSVHRYNVNLPNGGKQTLLESVGATHSGRDAQSADFTGATLSLQRGDQLYLKVSSVLKLPLRSKSRTFFGVFML